MQQSIEAGAPIQAIQIQNPPIGSGTSSATNPMQAVMRNWRAEADDEVKSASVKGNIAALAPLILALARLAASQQRH